MPLLKNKTELEIQETRTQNWTCVSLANWICVTNSRFVMFAALVFQLKCLLILAVSLLKNPWLYNEIKCFLTLYLCLILVFILDTENKDMRHLRKSMETIHCMGHKCSRKKHYYSRKCPKCVKICAFYGTAKNQDIELIKNVTP